MIGTRIPAIIPIRPIIAVTKLVIACSDTLAKIKKNTPATVNTIDNAVTPFFFAELFQVLRQINASATDPVTSAGILVNVSAKYPITHAATISTIPMIKKIFLFMIIPPMNNYDQKGISSGESMNDSS